MTFSLKNKLLIASVLLAVIPTIILTVLMAWIAADTGKEALEHAAFEKIKSIRSAKKMEIEAYFKNLNNQILTYSNNHMIIEAMFEFNATFVEYRADNIITDVDQYKTHLSQYYQEKFLAEYQNRNNSKISVDSILNTLDADSVALQYQYISANKHPLGHKDELVAASDNSEYSEIHKTYHPHIRDYLNKFGFYDIFLVDSVTGDIVYSVFKELDYTTSLINGPFANSGLGLAFQQANASNNPSYIALTDFAVYTPSYEDPAAFIASPIFLEGKKIGVLIFQMPIDRINAIMTYQQNWKASGLGATGETYIVGSDKKMRSLGRFLVEDKAAYLDVLQNQNLPSELINTIALKNTTIGLQAVETRGVNNALTGQSAVAVFPDYRNVSVVSAYAPLEIPGLDWAILSEVDESEAFAAVSTMRNKLYTWGGLALGLIAFLSFWVGRYFSQWIIEPIQYSIGCLNAIAGDIEKGHCDLVQQLDPGSNTIAIRLTSAINRMTNGYAKILREVKESAKQVSSSSKQMADNTQQAQEGINLQQLETEQVSNAMNTMTISALEVTENAIDGAKIAEEANQLSSKGAEDVQNTVKEIEVLAANIEQATTVIRELEQDSVSIGSVLDVIQGIAEQTNLLALNAAIEAARAGEQGRGFAVVADEVRSLASRTQDSTQEIQSIINKLQSGTKNAVKTMEESCAQAGYGVKQVQVTGEALSDIAIKVSAINQMASRIAKAADEQGNVVEEINQNIGRISEISEQNFAAAQNTSETADAMSEQAGNLQKSMSNFKL